MLKMSWLLHLISLKKFVFIIFWLLMLRQEGVRDEKKVSNYFRIVCLYGGFVPSS